MSNLKINNSSIYDIINNYQLKKHDEYRGNFYLSLHTCCYFASFAAASQCISNKIYELINKFSNETIFKKPADLTYVLLGLGTILFIKDKLKVNLMFKKAKYKLKRNGISTSTHKLKKAQVVVYNTNTNNNDGYYITEEKRAIIIKNHNREPLILKEIKKYSLDDDEIKPSYYITNLYDNNQEERDLILKKVKYKYGK